MPHNVLHLHYSSISRSRSVFTSSHRVGDHFLSQRTSGWAGPNWHGLLMTSQRSMEHFHPSTWALPQLGMQARSSVLSSRHRFNGSYYTPLFIVPVTMATTLLQLYYTFCDFFGWWLEILSVTLSSFLVRLSTIILFMACNLGRVPGSSPLATAFM